MAIPFSVMGLSVGVYPTRGIQRGTCGREGNPFHSPNTKPLVSSRPLPIPTMRRGLFFLQFCAAEAFPPGGVKVRT